MVGVGIGCCGVVRVWSWIFLERATFKRGGGVYWDRGSHLGGWMSEAYGGFSSASLIGLVCWGGI